MGVRRLSAAVAVGCAFLGLTSAASASSGCAGDIQVPTASSMAQSAFALACDINQVRAAYGLAPVRWDWQLWQAAQWMADDMARNHYVSHTASDGRDLFARVSATPYWDGRGDQYLLENLIWSPVASASAQMTSDAWMNSAEHRANMLDPHVTDIAIGISEGAAIPSGPDGFFYTAEFGSRPTPPIASTSVSTGERPVRARGRRTRACRRHVPLPGRSAGARAARGRRAGSCRAAGSARTRA